VKGLLSLRERNKVRGFDRSRLEESLDGCRRRSATEYESRSAERVELFRAKLVPS
jgi:hypothetical protein